MIQTSGIFTGGGDGGKYKPYLTFRSPYTFTLSVATPGWNGTVEYSTDTETWTTWDGSQVSAALSSAGDDAGYYALYLRGTGNTIIVGVATPNATGFTMNGMSIRCIGSIETLLDYATVEAGGHPSMGEQCFRDLFTGCSALVTAPDLPATLLAQGCYYKMFADCAGLVTAPELPALTLPGNCYWYMFRNCTSLIFLPRILATESGSFACTAMFANCAKIKLSLENTGEYTQKYDIAITDTYGMFANTGGTFTDVYTENNPTYYVSNTNIVV